MTTRLIFVRSSLRPLRLVCLALPLVIGACGASPTGGAQAQSNMGGGSGETPPSSSAPVKFFTKLTSTRSIQLWKTDATAAGTVPIMDIATAPESGTVVLGFIEYHGFSYFSLDDGVNGRELWRTDGSVAGTGLFVDIHTQPGAGSDPRQFTIFNGLLYFSATDPFHGRSLWRTDGTAAGTLPIKTLSLSGSFVEFGGALYFEADDGITGSELWKTDGTPDGTVLVKDINPQAPSSFPRELTVMNDTLYFTANDGTTGAELWKSDGTAAGTLLVKDITPAQPWNAAPADNNYRPLDLKASNGALYFQANDGEHGYELWKSDGSAAGTALVKDIDPTTIGPNPPSSFGGFTEFNGALYFSANNQQQGSELWKTDGTVEGTVLVKDINPTTGSSPSRWFAWNGRLYFEANDGVAGYELWSSDGSTAGTVLLKDLNPTAGAGSFPNDLSVLNGTLVFRANAGDADDAIWKTDGTSQGTILLKSLNP